MEVYAEYFKGKEGKEYRRKTLLCFNGGTELIGSAVLLNPGSAKPLGACKPDFVEKFYAQNHNEQLMDFSAWKSFRPDPTMKWLAKIFNGYYLGKPRELNGVIQLFNCFYTRNQNKQEATDSFDAQQDIVFDEAMYFKHKMVYFGWGKDGKSPKFCPITKKIFNAYPKGKQQTYAPDFMDNDFFHPRYVQLSHTHNDDTKRVLQNFYHDLWAAKL